MGHVTQEYKRWVPKAPVDPNFPSAYTLKCIRSIDELKEVLAFNTKVLAFDTETTGLNAEEIDIVGYSFCMDGKTAYYVPVWHFNFGLGEEALDLIYEKMCNTDTVMMFNMRYDTRVMEYHGFTTLFKEIIESDKSEEEKEKDKLKLAKRPFIKYDMSKVHTWDVQAVVYLADTNIKFPSLKASEEWYLGWRGASFEQTVSKAENPNAVTMKKDKEGNMVIKDMNFFYLTPDEAYEYAAIDALGTYLLGFKVKPFFDEARASGILDTMSLMPLTRFENELTLIDVDKLKKYSNIYARKIADVQNRCWTTAGRQFNLGSSKETNEVLKSLNISTGVYTKRGSMSTSKDAIQQCLKQLPDNDPNRQFLEDLTNYGTYLKQKSSYVDNIIEAAENNKFHKNRLRFGYKTTEVPSGRLAAGGDKKNAFVSPLNIQNIPKPHVTNHYVIPEDICKEYYPEVIEAIDKSGTLEEAETDLRYIDQDKIKELCNKNGFDYSEVKQTGKRWSYRIFGYVVSEEPWLIPGVEEGVVEGFIQELNSRSCFLPDPGYYFVTLDFNAEEIRIPALWSKEPAWLNAFKNHKDVHRSCYSLDTEFLTPNGFKTYDKIGFDDLIGQYDEDLRQVTWVKAGHKYFNETNKMYHFQGTHTDLLVTPNHRMYFKGRDNWYIKRADEAYKKKYLNLITSPGIIGESDYISKDYVIPSTSKKDEIRIKDTDFMELLGYILTDGGTCIKSQGQKQVYIGQSEAKPDILVKIQQLNNRLENLFTEVIDNNMEYSSYINGKEIKKTKPFHRFYITHAGFCDKLIKDFGGPLKKDRYLPRWFKNLPKELLQIFLNAYIAGDGSIDKRNNRTCITIYVENKQMVDDLQYICMRLGYSVNISKSDIYRLNIVPNRREIRINNKNTEIIKYDKPIKSVCFAVPTGLLVVRRNGKVSVCGNTAEAIWGAENYTKDKRKMAKGANFGLLYGMTAHNFKDRFNISYEEAQDFVDQFKGGLPTLFNWIKQCELEGEKFGTVYTMFGRPRRVKSWFDTGEWSWVSFAKRTCVNTKIQGTGADILKIVFIRLFEQFYKTNLTELVRFKFTIHDEIDYQIIKDKEHNCASFKKILKMIMQIMRVQYPGWEFPMEVGLSIGNRWGQTIDFDFDFDTLEVTGPKQDPISDGDICKALGIKAKKEEPERVTDSERSDEAISATIGTGWNGETISY